MPAADGGMEVFMKKTRWGRHFYQPGLPIGKDGRRVTAGEEHIALSRRAAAEGMVLLKNEDRVLPLRKGTHIALFGKGGADYVKGGGGSGDVTVSYVRNLIDGMRIKEQEDKVRLYEPLNEFYEEEVRKQRDEGIVPGMTQEPSLSDSLLKGAAAFADVAVISICRFSGENWDRTTELDAGRKTTTDLSGTELALLERAGKVFERGDFYLSQAEQKLVEQVKSAFDKVVIVLNAGGTLSASWFSQDDRISSVLMAWQAGMEGGLAEADILCGDANPSGKLADTFTGRLEDYPYSGYFHEALEYVNYTEDVYVGYRYFETISGKDSLVCYPFGFGLSYTQFRVTPLDSRIVGEDLLKKAPAAGEACAQSSAQPAAEAIFKGNKTPCLEVFAQVTNIGPYAGKEVVQLYASAPQGQLGKPARELKAFSKTPLLQPGETVTVRLCVPAASLASFDDLGKICTSAWVLEKGKYTFYLGTSVRDTVCLDTTLDLERDIVVERLHRFCAPVSLPGRLLADGTLEALPENDIKPAASVWEGLEKAGLFAPDTRARKGEDILKTLEGGSTKSLTEVAEGTVSFEDFYAQLSIEDRISLLCGQPNTGVANVYGMGNLPDYGVPNVMTADGPAGVRIRPEVGVTTTAFPCATLLACTWNEQLLEEVGRAGGSEIVENNLAIWLTPAMNIHRSPLCGRNFEYYSEDPLIAGKMAAALIRGIQSCGVSACAKHFSCNNKETNRFESDSRLSERALREIYLKGFEIAVKEADPWMIMSSYNLINGVRASENRELLTGILRDEWGYAGMVTTDWWNHAAQPAEIRAGNDVKMGCGYPAKVMAAFRAGEVTEAEIDTCAKRVLGMILRLE